MIISLNWLKEYVKINIPTPELTDLIGARLVEIEEVIDQNHKYDNIFVVRVAECEKIPETHLSLCKIDIGEAQVKSPKDENGFVQVLCGAPNVHKGMLAAWIAPGATVPSSLTEDSPFVIGTRKMRGYESHGMMASRRELDFGDEHDGIVEIDPKDAKAGDNLADIYDLKDTLLDIENKPLTHRPDTFGIIGFAREVAGILNQPFKTPDFLIKETADFTLKSAENLKISIKDSKLCPRYTALILERKKDLKQKYLTKTDTLLSRSGMRPIDPIVDATNYLMLLTGQPLHAFDYDKLVKVGGKKDPEIIVRAAKTGETIELLDGSEIKAIDSDILITSNNIPVALAGAMGTKNTAIDENTQKVILESATFSLYNLRKTQMAHGIFSEAITRFTKGQPAGGTLPVAKEFAALMASQMKPLAIFDEYPNQTKPNVVKITTNEINTLLGTGYSYEQIEETLRNVGFKITCDCGQPNKCDCEQIAVIAPYWRTDIHIKEDITEEVGRLLGFDNITPTSPLHQTASKSPLFVLKTKVRNVLSSNGANEVLTYSFVSERLVESAGQIADNSYKIVNSISPELQLFRQSLTPSLLEKARLNIKVPFDHFAIFEMNKTYQKSYGKDKADLPLEKNKLALVLSDRKSKNTAYYEAKAILETLLKNLNITAKFIPIKKTNATGAPYEPKRSAEIVDQNNNHIGILGEFTKSVQNNFKLPPYSAGFELDMDQLLELSQSVTAVSPLAFVDNITTIDITLSVSAASSYADSFEKIQSTLEKQDLIYQIEPVSIYQPENNSVENLTFRLKLSHKDRGLNTKEITDISRLFEQAS